MLDEFHNGTNLERMTIPAVLSTHWLLGYVIPLDVMGRLLADYPHIVGINCSTPDMGYMKRVIDLARTAWAADLLGNPGYTVRSVVHILGYASISHLAGAARRVAGTTPQELRAVGARGVLQRFIRGRTRSRV